jgi:hypothetical protein
MWYYALKVRGCERYFVSPRTFVSRRSMARMFHDEDAAKEAAKRSTLDVSIVTLNTAGDDR